MHINKKLNSKLCWIAAFLLYLEDASMANIVSED